MVLFQGPLEAAALVTGSWTVECFGLLASALVHGLLCWWVVKHLLPILFKLQE